MKPLVVDALTTLASRFEEQTIHVAAVWSHRLVPVCDSIRSLAAEGRILLQNGEEIALRRNPHPALSYRWAEQLAERLNAVGAPTEGEEWEAVVRDVLGEDYFELLSEEGKQSRAWAVEVADSTRRQVLLAGFAALNGLLEWWYTLAGELLTGKRVEARTRHDLTLPFARALGVERLSEARLGTAGVERALRLVANDIKHHGGLASQATKVLGCQKGAPLELTEVDLTVWTEQIASYVKDLTAALIQNANGHLATPNTTPAPDGYAAGEAQRRWAPRKR